MLDETHLAATPRHIDVSGVRFAFRQFGRGNGVPMLLLHHLNSAGDGWDPSMTGGLAIGRPVIILDGLVDVANDSVICESTDVLADHVARFVESLALDQVDLLGLGVGGLTAQAMTIQYPSLVRRLVLIGSQARGGRRGTMGAPLSMYMNPHSRKAGPGRPAGLHTIFQPTLVVNRSDDPTIPPSMTFDLARDIPNAQMILYSGSTIAPSAFTPTRIVEHANLFLSA